jgi:saccharopine dehydrogenase-like NADP-dependent oxidoreductase
MISTKTVLLFGAGKSASVLIEYLVKNGPANNWKLIVADKDLQSAQSGLKGSERDRAVSFDVQDKDKRIEFIQQADIVISLLPPTLHYLVAIDCLQLKKHLLTASYIDEKLKLLSEEIKNNHLLFLCEMGLDPGIDHMSAKKIIDEVHAEGGIITSFISHCGGLVAPENDDNPWHYKISWNSRNIVNAGKAGAVFKANGIITRMDYTEVFQEKRFLKTSEELFCWYPNRDSLAYLKVYDLPKAETFIRTTIRHPDFMYGWKNIIELKLTDENLFYETDNMSLMGFFKEHMERNNFNNWLEQKLKLQLEETQGLLNNLLKLVKLEEDATNEEVEKIEDFMLVNEKGDLEKADVDDLKNNAAATIAFKMHESKLTLQQLFYLGMDDDKTLINKGRCSAADVLQFALETKLKLKEEDKDLVMMRHEIEYESENKKRKVEAALSIKGDDNQRTAMAKTVGLPLGIATKLILNGTIQLEGLHIPTDKKIYEPVLKELEEHGITFTTS